MKKVVLITGASSGMGREMAQLLSKNDFTVYAAARRTKRMEDLTKTGIHTLAMDVTDETSMTTGIKQIIANEGRIDALINNAGFGSYGSIEEVPAEDARHQLEVNVFGAARLIQLVLPYMRAQHSGRIINISSIGGKVAMPLGGWYHASKFALEALSDSLRAEVGQFGIDVVVIEPGGVKSEWADIAVENGLKNSGNGVYGPMVRKFAGMQKSFANRLPEPKIIADIVLKAILARRPKTRYVAGFMARPMLAMRKLLSDRLMDRLMLSQLK
ncbi:MAG: SDR family NAD(P)-dependent oxidoreductase [Bacteroidetes bacterium]|nr:SDR family NAD(P)-dependent oxidoreductase [Bacteroidota bacterium]